MRLPDLPEAATWAERRALTIGLFETNVYGHSPPLDAVITESGVRVQRSTVHESVQIRQSGVRMVRDGRSHGLDLAVFLPLGARPWATVLALNSDGNHTASPDPDLTMPGAWVPDRAQAATAAHVASTRGRGALASSWPVEMLTAAGVAVATVYAGDIAPDDPAQRHAAVTHTLGLAIGSAPMGTIGAWAWGLRAVGRHLRGLPELAGSRLVVLGHSRLGKAALWAAAQDEVFDAVVSNDSGCGGAALSRRDVGESVEAITTSFPHWFTPAFGGYAGREDDLPIDQHLLLAAVAPRAVYVGSALADEWADPQGEYEAVLAAAPIHRAYGGGAIGYHLRPGPHGLTEEDWAHYLTFFSAHLRT